MPPGVPVATVAINGAKNAGLLAIQILGLQDDKLQAKYIKYKEDLNKMVLDKADKLESQGWQNYEVK